MRVESLPLRVFLIGLMGLASMAPASSAASQDVERDEVVRLLRGLAADSMEGRRTGTEGARRAAGFIAAELESHGIEPAGDEGYFQRIPLRSQGSRRIRMLPSMDDLAEVPDDEILIDGNVIGLLRGADPDLRDEVVVLGAHFDHLGVGRPVDGDSVYNGADDDASGVVAVLEAARVLSAQALPKRSVLFLLTTGEEQGLLGSRWYVQHPVVPLERTVANLQIEMIGRPDPESGGSGRAWLTGYERSTIGPSLQDAGIPVGPDRRPEQGFFERSDNIVFAREGVPAHTLSSFGLHEDYHRPGDEVKDVDLDHLTLLVQAVADAVRLLANGDRPEWMPAGRPTDGGR